ncbi:PH domain-containing protein [Agromyces larvae]
MPVPADAQALLVKGEHAITSFRTIRDYAIVSRKRLIVRDAQG